MVVVGLNGSVVKEYPLPQIPSTPSLGWKHMLVQVVLRNPKMAIAELKRAASDYYLCQTDSSYMQTEEAPLLPDLPLHTLITWTRWWHLTAKALVLVFRKRTWGAIGPFLRREIAKIDNRIVETRKDWAAKVES